MAYLHSDREQFRDAIDLAYEQTGVMVQAIEKDYYVTMLLRLLAQKIAVRRSWDVWSGIPVHLQVFWQMSAIVVMYWQERPLHRTF